MTPAMKQIVDTIERKILHYNNLANFAKGRGDSCEAAAWTHSARASAEIRDMLVLADYAMTQPAVCDTDTPEGAA